MQTFFCTGGFYARRIGDFITIKFGARDPENGVAVTAAIGTINNTDALALGIMLVKMANGVPFDAPMDISFPPPPDPLKAQAEAWLQ
jgi:hypothetical protein